MHGTGCLLLLAFNASMALSSDVLHGVLHTMQESKAINHNVNINSVQYYVSYNCLSMVAHGRWDDVLHEFRSCKVVALQGTRQKQFNLLPVHVFRNNGVFSLFMWIPMQSEQTHRCRVAFQSQSNSRKVHSQYLLSGRKVQAFVRSLFCCAHQNKRL